eukprot:1149923-Pelagomonas_calceolata.AAC.10
MAASRHIDLHIVPINRPSADAAAPDPGAPGQHKRSKASKSSGSQQQRKEQHQERQEGRVDLAAGQRSHSTAALEVTPLHDKVQRMLAQAPSAVPGGQDASGRSSCTDLLAGNCRQE